MAALGFPWAIRAYNRMTNSKTYEAEDDDNK
jgi:hypothetical protein